MLRLLVNLDLGANMLTTLKEKSFKQYFLLKNIRLNRMLQIDNNPLTCDCEMVWIRKLVSIHIQIIKSNQYLCSANISNSANLSCFMRAKLDEQCSNYSIIHICNKGTKFHYMHLNIHTHTYIYNDNLDYLYNL